MTLALGLFFAGIVLLLLEFVLPGLIAGIAGTALLVGAGFVAIREWPEYTLLIIVGEIAATTLVLGIGLYVFSRSGMSRRLVHTHEQDPDAGYVNVTTNKNLLGARGVVYTPLRPAGTIMVNNERLDAVSDGTFIDSGVTVVVTQVHGNRVVVEAAAVEADEVAVG